MPWARVEETLDENQKLAGVSDAGFRLWILAITWSNRKLQDGFIPKTQPMKLVALRRPDVTIKELIEAKLWHQSGRPCRSCLELRAAKGVTDEIPLGGYLIHHYHEFQPSKWSVLKKREEMRAIGRRGGQASVEAKRDIQAPRLNEEGSDEEEVNRHAKRGAQPPRLSATLERHANRSAQAPRSTETPEMASATLERHAQPRTPVPPSSGSIDPVPSAPRPEEPTIPDAPEDADRLRDQARREGVRHVRGAAAQVVAEARGRAAS